MKYKRLNNPVIITLLIFLIAAFIVPIAYIKTIIYFNGDPVLWDQQFKFLVVLPILFYTFSLTLSIEFLRKRGITFLQILQINLDIS